MTLSLAELQALCDAATPGPWEPNPRCHNAGAEESCGVHGPLTNNPHREAIGGAPYPADVFHDASYDECHHIVSTANAAFICAARTALPELLARVRQLEAALGDIRYRLDEALASPHGSHCDEKLRQIRSRVTEAIGTRRMP